MTQPRLITVGAAGLPAGEYEATFQGWSDVPPNDRLGYGPAIRLVWQLANGQLATRFCTNTPTAGNITGRLIQGLIGRPLVPGEAIDLNACVGRKYRIRTEQLSKGEGSRVAAVEKL